MHEAVRGTGRPPRHAYPAVNVRTHDGRGMQPARRATPRIRSSVHRPTVCNASGSVAPVAIPIVSIAFPLAATIRVPLVGAPIALRCVAVRGGRRHRTIGRCRSRAQQARVEHSLVLLRPTTSRVAQAATEALRAPAADRPATLNIHNNRPPVDHYPIATVHSLCVRGHGSIAVSDEPRSRASMAAAGAAAAAGAPRKSRSCSNSTKA